MIGLPQSFRPFFWSYDFTKLDPQKNKKTVILNLVNYGNLKHWRWLVDFYGIEAVASLLKRVPVTEIRPRVLRLVSILFHIENFNYASRGPNNRK